MDDIQLQNCINFQKYWEEVKDSELNQLEGFFEIGCGCCFAAHGAVFFNLGTEFRDFIRHKNYQRILGISGKVLYKHGAGPASKNDMLEYEEDYLEFPEYSFPRLHVLSPFGPECWRKHPKDVLKSIIDEELENRRLIQTSIDSRQPETNFLMEVKNEIS